MPISGESVGRLSLPSAATATSSGLAHTSQLITLHAATPPLPHVAAEFCMYRLLHCAALRTSSLGAELFAILSSIGDNASSHPAVAQVTPISHILHTPFPGKQGVLLQLPVQVGSLLTGAARSIGDATLRFPRRLP